MRENVKRILENPNTCKRVKAGIKKFIADDKQNPMVIKIPENYPFLMNGQVYRWRKNKGSGIVLESPPQIQLAAQFTISTTKKSKQHGSRKKT